MSQGDKIKKLEKLLQDQHTSNIALKKKIKQLEQDNKLLKEVLDKLNKPS